MSRGLLVCETYPCIVGESSMAGTPAFLVRLAGCNLRCTYCDTPYAREGGETAALEAVLRRALESGLRTALVTGGEPLLQEATPALLSALCDAGLAVLLETNGSADVSPLDRRVRRVVDWKTPGSGEGNSFLGSNLDAMGPGDEMKFVLTGRGDYEWARDLLKGPLAGRPFPVLLSPAWDLLAPKELAAWMIQDGLGARLSLQLHKMLFGPDARGV